ncbi:hypothetical protein Q8004_10420 [Edwardsiella piscicida]|nr:hypothetical protein N4G58_06285 [Edwardsiella piscicida]WLJ42327.1 hypothetical protein Q8004_10420 [Edwardsiella piscicida]
MVRLFQAVLLVFACIVPGKAPHSFFVVTRMLPSTSRGALGIPMARTIHYLC